MFDGLIFVQLVMMQNKTYTLLILLLIAFGLKAQEVKGPYLVFNLLKNSSISYLPNTYQNYRIIIDSTANGEFTLTGTKYDPEVNYTPAPGFIGKDTATYEYKDFSGKFKYLSFIFEVTKSYLNLKPDVYSVELNSSELDIYPLQNDSSSIGSYAFLSIKSIGAANQLVASRPNDTTIRFRPNTGFKGIGYISYTVCDTFNHCQDGNIVVNVIDPNNQVSDSFYIGTPKSIKASVPLPQSGYSTFKAPANGNLEYDTDYSVLYKPISTFTGNDTFIVFKNGLYRTVFMEVYPMKTPSKITVDDYYFLPKDSTIQFNVALNDIVDKYPFLLNQGPSRGNLTKLNNQGDFSYQPESGYEGVQSFTYKVCPQGNCEFGEVKLFVGNWQPDNRTAYNFATPKNVPLVFSYHIPIDAYDFSSAEDSVKFYPGYDTIYLDYKGCKDTIIGFNTLIYYPPKDFVGSESFIVEYCISSTNECIEAECIVEIFLENKNCNLQCAGDCVWPGDVNLDGDVSMLDLLEIGYNLGNEGSSRMYQSTGIFRALRADDWSKSLPNGFANLKHGDADGNGKIDCADTLYVSNFYRKQHSLVPKPVYDRGDFPFVLNVLTPNADSGDLAIIEIQLGDNDYPVINLGGYAYELDYNTDVVYEPSLEVGFYNQGWATLNSAVLHMAKKPWDGRLESGFVRSKGKPVSGKGGVEYLSFIVEDNLDGFRKDGEYFEVPFYFSNIHTQNDLGQLQKLEDRVAYIKIGRKKEKENVLDPADLLVYPVPATGDLLNLHINGKNTLKSIALYSMQGNLLRTINTVDLKHQQIDVTGLHNGLYMIVVETALGPLTKKIEILR